MITPPTSSQALWWRSSWRSSWWGLRSSAADWTTCSTHSRLHLYMCLPTAHDWFRTNLQPPPHTPRSSLLLSAFFRSPPWPTLHCQHQPYREPTHPSSSAASRFCASSVTKQAMPKFCHTHQWHHCIILRDQKMDVWHRQRSPLLILDAAYALLKGAACAMRANTDWSPWGANIPTMGHLLTEQQSVASPGKAWRWRSADRSESSTPGLRGPAAAQSPCACPRASLPP